ncbi:MAG: hypothetical protein RSD88_07385 [Anaerovoracaceae bacterium]
MKTGLSDKLKGMTKADLSRDITQNKKGLLIGLGISVAMLSGLAALIIATKGKETEEK